MLSSRGFIKALLLLSGKKFSEENVGVCLQKMYSLLKNADRALFEPLFDGVDLASTMLAFVMVNMAYFYDAVHEDVLATEQLIALVVVIIGVFGGLHRLAERVSNKTVTARLFYDVF